MASDHRLMNMRLCIAQERMRSEKSFFFILIKFLVVGGFYYSELSNHFNLQLQKVIALTLLLSTIGIPADMRLPVANVEGYRASIFAYAFS